MYVDYKEIGTRISERRKELGLKQSQVNELAGLGDKYLSNIERATSIPSVEVIMKLCEILKTTPDYLLLGTAGSSPPSTEYERQIKHFMKKLNQNQLRFAANFLAWLSTQKF